MDFDELTVRARNVLLNAANMGIKTPNELRCAAALHGMSISRFLMSQQNCGEKSVAEILEWCGEPVGSSELDKARAEIERLAIVAHDLGRCAGYSEVELIGMIGYQVHPQLDQPTTKG